MVKNIDGIVKTPSKTEQRSAPVRMDDNMNYQKKPRRSKKVWKTVFIVILIALVLGLAGWGIYAYMEIDKMQSPDYIQKQAQQEKNTLVEKVGKLMELPDEEPVIATVDDISAPDIKGNPFFEKAENGDKLLIFSKSSQAVIYRESTNKIINYGPVAITSSELE